MIGFQAAMSAINKSDPTLLRAKVEELAFASGFHAVGFSDVELSRHEAYLEDWLQKGFQGEMGYMSKHGKKRSRPDELEPGTISVICVRMDYWPGSAADAWQTLSTPDTAYVSRYALGRDYHKLMRKRLSKMTQSLQSLIGEFGYRVFVDSAPVLEKALAEKAGLGWIGKHSNLLHSSSGSWFFLGEIYTDLPLASSEATGTDRNDNEVSTSDKSGTAVPIHFNVEIENTSAENSDSKNIKAHCGSCTACIEACPTRAIVAPYKVDARRCISYLTIELRGSIPVEFRNAMGNRIYGCDDCQLVCPFNKFSSDTTEADFEPRHELDSSKLIDLFAWTAEEFDSKTLGSAIRRIGYECWLRNIAVALGNATTNDAVMQSLEQRRNDPSELVREHTLWALQQHRPDATI